MIIMHAATFVVIGDEFLTLQCAEILLDRGHVIRALVSTAPRNKDWANSKQIPILATIDELTGTLEVGAADWLLSIANLNIIGKGALALPRLGTINFHDGLLPELAGLNAPTWSIIEGNAEHGVTWHRVGGGVDEGDILSQSRFVIAPDETALTLNAKCLEAGMASFVELVEQLEKDSLRGVPQDLAQRRYYAKNKRPDALGTLDFAETSASLSRLVRALSFGDNYRNPLVTPKVWAQSEVFSVSELQIGEDSSQLPPGTVVKIVDGRVWVSTSDFDVGIVANPSANGHLLAQIAYPGLKLGLEASVRSDLTRASKTAIAAEPEYRAQLARVVDVELPLLAQTRSSGEVQLLQLNISAEKPIEVIAAFFSRLTAQPILSFAYSNQEYSRLSAQFPGYFASSTPLNFSSAPDIPVGTVVQELSAALEEFRDRGPYLADLIAREPGLSEPTLSIGLYEGAAPSMVSGSAITIAVGGASATLMYDEARLTGVDAERLAGFLEVFSKSVQASPEVSLKQVPILSAGELNDLLYTRNATAVDLDRSVCVHNLIERQVVRTPDTPAVTDSVRTLTYRQLDDAANKLAATLIERGVTPGSLVGLHLPRTVDLVVAVYGIHKAGGAYVPLDPDFPNDRINYMIDDSDALLVVTDVRHAAGLALERAKLVLIEDVLAGPITIRPRPRAVPSDLAYVIYTSGSTGRPKGVMVEHGNVVNFFAGMDQRIPVDPQGNNVWLAVTSLSFDISVLELCWTLTRGFKIVLHRHHAAAAKADSQVLSRAVDFGLFFWGNDEGVGPSKYQLLLEGARIADNNGFNAIWTPERHFGAFGGPYPNPAVTGAAVAAITKNLSIRAGSCVLPLHHPARVAEDWAIIDNLSNGRVALSFASGWMPEDFVLRPENAPPNNKTAMVRDIDTVRRLWRGEQVTFSLGGADVAIVTQPRPIQPELPIWVTTAGNPDTFREAARQGGNILTHLLGQSVEELADKIRIYRETLAELGHDPAKFKVTLMLHTLLGDDREIVREQARQPMKDYLRSATALIKQYAWAFPAFKKPAGATQAMDVDLRSLSEEELDGILDYAFLRYFEESGLFGTVEDGWDRVRQVSAIGVDEIACLIDYGIPTPLVLEGLQTLSQLVQETKSAHDPQDLEDADLESEVRRHGVTHLQCTPSMAMMFLSSDKDRQALGEIRHLFIGGEALNSSLVHQLRSSTAATIENMYGPTETTIWSSTLTVQADVDGVVPIGTPIANTQLYVLDPNQQAVPTGFPGELFISGDGVTRGYYNRPELTQSRFLPDPATGGRMYRTGDLVNIDQQSGQIKFIGRTDFQVKIRGYRIELGEIETAIGGFAGVKETVVLARQDDNADTRLVAYIRLSDGELNEQSLRAHLSAELPSYMVPSHFVVMDAFPLTPNAKVDRNRLPAPVSSTAAAGSADSALAESVPQNQAERTIAEAFKRTLGLQNVGLNDNFFALGGHSLLAVHMHRDLKLALAPDLAITDIFRYPTVAGLALRIAQGDQPDARLTGTAQRAAGRRNAMVNRFRSPPG